MPPGKDRSEGDEVNVQVIVRCRPLTADELAVEKFPAVKCDEARREVNVNIPSVLGKYSAKRFTYDQVFGHDCTQAHLYAQAISPIVEEVLKGFNCTIFAYGQTGTGKTHTMEGKVSNGKRDGRNNEGAGVIPRAVQHIFDSLEKNQVENSVRVSFLELYNEELQDLLDGESAEKRALRILEDPRKGTTVMNLEEIIVTSASEIFDILEKTTIKRRTAETLLNKYSSRSHSIFTITIHMKECTPEGEDILKIGKLNLVDLAGSESVGRSGAQSQRAKEAGMINQSLLTLGRVITALVEHQPHVPYRDSKLTRLLQDSLGGRTKTCIIATVSPSASCMEESLSTLDYAHRAKNIRNRPEVNMKMTRRVLMKEYNAEIETLKEQLKAARDKNGVYLPAGQYEKMETQLREQAEALEYVQAQLEAKMAELTRANELLDSTTAELDETKEALRSTKELLERTSAELRDVREELARAKVAIEEREAIISARAAAEEELSRQGRRLVGVAVAATSDVDSLHRKIERKQEAEAATRERALEFARAAEARLDALQRAFRDHEGADARWAAGARAAAAAFCERSVRALAGVAAQLDALASGVAGRCEAMATASGAFGRAAAEELGEGAAAARAHAAAVGASAEALLREAGAALCAAREQVAAAAGEAAGYAEAVRGDIEERAERDRRFADEAARLVSGIAGAVASFAAEHADRAAEHRRATEAAAAAAREASAGGSGRC
eukprot:tig00020848_g14584.t1